MNTSAANTWFSRWALRLSMGGVAIGIAATGAGQSAEERGLAILDLQLARHDLSQSPTRPLHPPLALFPCGCST